MSKVIESIETSHAQQVATLNQQIATLNSQLADRKSIIDLQADKIKSQADEIARLQKVIDDLRAMPSSYDIEEYIRNNPFTVGVAEKQEQPRAQV
jgi:TolA-binding protein